MTPSSPPAPPGARRAALTEPRLAAYLPLVYMAWADGVIIGAIGVSGSTVENDHTVAAAGAAVVK